MSGMSSYSGRALNNVGATVPKINFTSTIVKYEGDTAKVNATSDAEIDFADFTEEVNDYQTTTITDSMHVEIITGAKESSGGFFSFVGKAIKGVGQLVASAVATTVEVAASLCKGVLNVAENIVDGVVQLGGALVAGGAWVSNQLLGTDWDVQKIKDTTQAIVSFQAVNTVYDATIGSSKFIQENSVAPDWLLKGAETVGTIAGYAAVSMIPGVGGTLVAASAAAGAAANQAYANGATFEQATLCAAVAAGAGTLSKVGLNGINGAASQAATMTEVFKYAGEAALVGATVTPLSNTATQYFTYGKNMVNENGDPMSFIDYANATGMWTQMAIGGAAAGIGTGIKGYNSVVNYNANFNAKMDNMTPEQRSKAWEDYYNKAYKGDAQHVSGITIAGSNGSFVDNPTSPEEYFRRSAEVMGYKQETIDRYIKGIKEENLSWKDEYNKIMKNDALTDAEKQAEIELLRQACAWEGNDYNNSLYNAAEVTTGYYERAGEGWFTDSADDELVRKMNANSTGNTNVKLNPQRQIGTNGQYTNLFPSFDEGISDARVIEYTKQLYGINGDFATVDELGQYIQEHLGDGTMTVRRIVVQSSEIGAKNMVRFGSIGNGQLTDGYSNNVTGGFFGSVQSIEDFANKYPDICKIENGQLVITDIAKFGDKALGGVKLGQGGVYMIEVTQPVQPGMNSIVSCPSVNNAQSYFDNFIGGGETQGGVTEVVTKAIDPKGIFINQIGIDPNGNAIYSYMGDGTQVIDGSTVTIRTITESK